MRWRHLFNVNTVSVSYLSKNVPRMYSVLSPAISASPKVLMTCGEIEEGLIVLYGVSDTGLIRTVSAPHSQLVKTVLRKNLADLMFYPAGVIIETLKHF